MQSAATIHAPKAGKAKTPPASLERFTPRNIDTSLCMARTWASGRGGQCTKQRSAGSDFCSIHSNGLPVHGRVDGPIPKPKLKEFEKALEESQGIVSEAAAVPARAIEQ